MPRLPPIAGTRILDASRPDLPEIQQRFPLRHPLPRLTVRRRKGEEVIAVIVHHTPENNGEGFLVWLVDERPAQQLRKGVAVRLSISANTNGVGRLSAISGMSKHWVSFKVSGSHDTCRLRVPVPWVALTAIEGHAHTCHYRALAALPAPHRTFSIDPIIALSDDSPYEFETHHLT